MAPIRTLIMGAAGRDFHNFNVGFRDNADYEVVAFTATQSPTSRDAHTRRNWQGNCIQRAFRSTPKRSW